jgi:hypothetical protein
MDALFSTCSLDVLLQEPARLEESIASLKRQFDESMTTNYDFFLRTCENASTITEDLESCTATVSDLSAQLSHCGELCTDLCLLGQSTIAANSKISAAFRHLPQVTDIIEIPQLMKTCIVSNLPSLALELFQAIDRFARQYPGIPIIQATLEAAQTRKAEVAESLLKRFDGKMKIAEMTQAVTLLRTAGLHSESELRLAVVNGKRKRLHEKVAQLSKLSPVEHAIRLTGKVRNSLFIIPTVYQTLFQDPEDLILNMAVQYELREYCGVIGRTLNAISDFEDVKRVLAEVLEFVRSMAGIGFNFSALVDTMFYQSKWG